MPPDSNSAGTPDAKTDVRHPDISSGYVSDDALQKPQRPISTSDSKVDVRHPDISSGYIDQTPTPAPADQNQQPSVLHRVGQATEDEIKQFGPQDHHEEIAQAIGGTPGMMAYRMSRQMVNATENLVSGKTFGDEYHQAKNDFLKAVTDFHQKKYGQAAAETLSTAADATGVAVPGMGPVMEREREIAKGAEPGGDVVTPITKSVIEAAPALLGAFPEGEAAEGSEAEGGAGEAEEAAPKKPGIIQKVLKGKAAVSPQAEETLRETMRPIGEGAGVQEEATRTVAEEPIRKLHVMADANYDAVDKATGGDFKQWNLDLEEAQYKVKQAIDPAEKARAIKERDGLVNRIAEARKDATDRGIDVKQLDEADSQFRQAKALERFDKRILKNQSVIDPTTGEVHIDALVRELQKLRDLNEYGSNRLGQALGSADDADELLDKMKELKLQGISAMKLNNFAKLLWKYTKIGGITTAAGGITYEIGKNL